MKKITFFIVAFFMISLGFGQGNFQVVQQQQAHYPKGDVAFQEYFNLNLKYTQAAYDKRLYGSVMVSFNVLADSTVTEVTVLSGLGYGVDEEIVKMITQMKFAPAVSNGVVVRSNMIVSINVKAIESPELEIEKQ
jgi:periplasmic protein TonB